MPDSAAISASAPSRSTEPATPPIPPPAEIATREDASRIGDARRWPARIAVRCARGIAIVPVPAIVRLEADDNYVRIWADRLYVQKTTLTRLCARLDPDSFLRVHRSHAVNLRLVRELKPRLHGEFTIVLADGSEVTSGRSYKALIEGTLGLA